MPPKGRASGPAPLGAQIRRAEGPQNFRRADSFRPRMIKLTGSHGACSVGDMPETSQINLFSMF